MIIDTLPRQLLAQPRSRAFGRLPNLWAWLRQDHGLRTDLAYGMIPLVPMAILLSVPGNSLVKAMGEYALLAVLIFLGLFLHGAWRWLRTWHLRRVERT